MCAVVPGSHKSQISQWLQLIHLAGAVKHNYLLQVLFHALILALAFSPHQQSPSMVFRLVVKPIESS